MMILFGICGLLTEVGVICGKLIWGIFCHFRSKQWLCLINFLQVQCIMFGIGQSDEVIALIVEIGDISHLIFLSMEIS